MKRLVRSAAVATAAPLLTLLACASAKPARPPGAEPAKVAAGTLPRGPEAPEHGLPVPSLEVAWEPPQVVAGDMHALRDALQPMAALKVFTGRRLRGPAWPRRLTSLMDALRPGAEPVTVGQAGRRAFFGSEAALPLTRVAGASPPRYETTGLAVHSVGKAILEKAGRPALMIDDAGVDAAAWRSLPAHAVGTCDPAFSALASGQEQSLAYLEPFLDHVDAVLWQIYRAQLDATLPELEQFMAPYEAAGKREEFESAAAFETHKCGHEYWKRLQAYRGCGATSGRCAVAPRIYLIGGARIGSAEPSSFIDDSCDEKVGRDVPDELRELGREAADAAVAHLDLPWSTLADRLGAVTEVHDALEDLCTPRRRRFAAADLAASRSRLERIGRALASDEVNRPRGQWEVVDSAFFVPGVGPVTQLARFRPGQGSAAHTVLSESRALRQFVLSRALCRSGYGDLPLAAVVLDPEHEQSQFLGYYYEEELFCADLPPRLLPAAAAPRPAASPSAPAPAPPPPT